MNAERHTNATIHRQLSSAADAISRARDDLKERDKQTAVSIYSFRQMQRAVHSMLLAYRVAIENSILCDADLRELMSMSAELTSLLERVAILPDVVEPISNEPDENYTG